MTNTLRYFCGRGLESFPHFPFCLFNRDGLSLSFSFPVKSLKCILHQNTMSKDVKSYTAYTVIPKVGTLYNLLFSELIIWGWTRNQLTGTRLCMFVVPRQALLEFPSCKMGSWGQRALKTQRLVSVRIPTLARGSFGLAMCRTSSFWDSAVQRQMPISSLEGSSTVPWKCLLFLFTWEPSFIDKPRKLKFKVQLKPLHFQIVKNTLLSLLP